MDAAALFHALPRKVDLGLDRVRAALSLFGDPHASLPPVVHLAGTNGKGSTLAFLRAMAEAGGLKVHAYTSPHLARIHERWRLAGRLVDEPRLLDVALRVARVAVRTPLTVFEAETVAAFVLFAEHPADLVLLETGLGGRLDATNVVERPELTVITTIDLDHTDMLGPDIATIAGEKAGIIKAGRPCVIGVQRPEALAVLEARAGRLDAPTRVFGRDFDAWPERGGMAFQTGSVFLDLPPPALAGRHQIANAAAAAMAALELGLSPAAVSGGVAGAVWPGRMQRIAGGPLAAPAGVAGLDLWLDGGHNPHGAAAAAAHMRALGVGTGGLGLICGLLSTKDSAGFFRAFGDLRPLVACVPIPGSPQAADPGELAAAARSEGLDAQAADSCEAALAGLAGRLPPGGRILICGSLHLAGHVLSQWPDAPGLS